MTQLGNLLPEAQRPGEPILWYGRFQYFLELGPERSVSKVQEEVLGHRRHGLSRSYTTAAKRWEWHARAKEWDHLNQQPAISAIEEIKQLTEETVRIYARMVYAFVAKVENAKSSEDFDALQFDSKKVQLISRKGSILGPLLEWMRVCSKIESGKDDGVSRPRCLQPPSKEDIEDFVRWAEEDLAEARAGYQTEQEKLDTASIW